MASPTIRGSVTPAAGLSATSPSDTAIGDLVVVVTWEVTTGSTPPTHTLQSGFDEIVQQGLTEASSSGNASIAYKVATATGAQSYQAYTTNSGTTDYWTGLIVYTTGTFTTAGIISLGTSTTNTTNPNPPGLTGLTSGTEYCVTCYGFWRVASAATNNAGTPLNYTDIWETTASQIGHLAARHRDLTGVTAEDPAAITDTVTPTGTCAITIALAEPPPDQPLTGTLYQLAPTFFTGVLTATYPLAGTLFTKAPTFFAGVVSLASTYTNLVVVELSDAGAAVVDTDHFLRAIARTDAGTGSIRLRLFQSTTLIETFEFTPTSTFAYYDQELSEAEAATITDYSDLQVHIDLKATATPFTPQIDRVDLLRPVAVADQTLTGTLYQNTPTFFTGAVTTSYTLAGTLYQNSPSFFTGSVASTYSLTGTLYQNTPTFFTGAVTTTYALTGTLYQNSPTFFGGVVTTGAVLTGVLYQNTPVFFTGSVTTVAGPQTISGVLFTKAPTFFTGALLVDQTITGTLFQKAPTFFAGSVSSVYPLTGTLYQNTPVFFTGSILADQTISGVLYQNTPVFFVGVFAPAGSLFGNLYQNTPVFFVGTMGYTGGSFWQVNPAGYTLNPAAYTVNGAAYDPILGGELPPWAIEVDGEVFELAPLFFAGSVS